ncbi:MAG: anthranilate synthase component I family protein [Rikenellaceae bacterium]
MKEYKYNIAEREFSGDLHTPVSLYLKLRDLYEKSALLESSDYNAGDNSRSFLAVDPMAEISINNGRVSMSFPDKKELQYSITESYTPSDAISQFMSHFDIDGDHRLFGYTAYNSVKYLENIAIEPSSPKDNDAPDILYVLYRYIIVFDHFHHTLTIRELVPQGEMSQMKQVVSAIESRNFASYGFQRVGDTTSPISDEQYREMVHRGVAHCMRGDVFQIVLSRRFVQRYTGDDFAVYRKLRRINPSPYLFYYDFGGFRIFGSSPEIHCKVENNQATIDPIAGTAFRSGDMAEDARRAEALLVDPKENAEHVMLVDLARNDLSRNAQNVHVEFYKQVQYYSHVIHLVSRVTGDLKEGVGAIKSYMDTFPAGTLSGAPKVRAMQLINDIESHSRGIYGGAIGYIGFRGDANHAITIRTFVSRNGQLEFQAGAGIVSLSDPERELQEVNNKLGALSRAIKEDIE